MIRVNLSSSAYSLTQRMLSSVVYYKKNVGNKNVTGNQYLQGISKVCDKYPVNFNIKNKSIHSCKYQLKMKINTTL